MIPSDQADTCLNIHVVIAMVSRTGHQILFVRYLRIRRILSKYPFSVGNCQPDRPLNIIYVVFSEGNGRPDMPLDIICAVACD